MKVTKVVKRASVSFLQIHTTEWVQGINKMCKPKCKYVKEIFTQFNA